MNKRVTLWRGDKIAYGTYYAYNNLHYLFNNATIVTSPESPETFIGEDAQSAYIILGHNMMPSESELRAILNQVYGGGKLFISAIEIGKNLLDSFKLSASSGRHFLTDDSLSVKLIHKYDSLTFSYPGNSMDNHFTGMDSSFTRILGTNAEGQANFVAISFDGGGEVLIHLAPAALTNFFLLHKKNKEYYDHVMAAIPDSVSNIRWDDYYRSHIDGVDISQKSGFSKLDELLKNEALRWAFWLTIILFLIIYLFESKRKQRVIPTIAKPVNSSVEFVETVGRLYFQRRDNKNLASKMITHWLSHIRTSYNLPTSDLSEEFEKKLTFKTGFAPENIQEIIQSIKQIEGHASLSDEELLAFSNKLDKFYKRN